MKALRRFFHSETMSTFEEGQDVPESVAQSVPSEWVDCKVEELQLETKQAPKKTSATKAK